MIDIAEQTVVAALEACDVGHNNVFIKAAFKRTLNVLVVSILDDLSSITESFKDTVLQVATALASLATIASEVVKDTAAIASNARYAAKIVKQGLEKSVKSLVLTPPSSPPSGSDSAFDEACKSRKEKAFLKK